VKVSEHGEPLEYFKSPPSVCLGCLGSADPGGQTWLENPRSLDGYPLVMTNKKLLKIAIYSEFSH